MAFLDFLGQGIGGTTPSQTAPGMFGEGNVTTQQAMPIGPTYGDVLKTGMQYGSKPGSSAPAIAGAIPNSGWQQRSMQPLASNAPPQAKQAATGATGATGEGTGNDVLKMIEGFFRNLFLSGGGGV